jgi:hypothetical protein
MEIFRLKPTYNQELYNALSQNDMPPTLYSLMESKVNYNNENKVSISELPSAFKSFLFDFNYPIDVQFKNDFEETFLLHYMFRRINYDTYLSFKLHLEVKLKSIMPKYNKMLLGFKDLDFTGDTETITRTLTDEREINEDNSSTGSATSSGTSSSQSSGTSSNTTDNRYSDTPQGQLTNVQNGTYLSDYTYNQASGTSSDTSSSSLSNTSSSTGSETKEKTDNLTTNETIEHVKLDSITEYKKFLDYANNIYDMIFKECDSLFFGVV